MTTDPTALEAELLRLRELLDAFNDLPTATAKQRKFAGAAAEILLHTVKNHLPALLTAFELQRGVLANIGALNFRTKQDAEFFTSGDPLQHIKDKCAQYWNEHHINDEEIHVVVEWIHKRASEGQAEILRLTQALQEARAQLEGRPNGPK